MSGLAASAILTPYLPTNQVISRVVSAPPFAPATRPGKVVIACFGIKYCGKTFRRSDTAMDLQGTRFSSGTNSIITGCLARIAKRRALHSSLLFFRNEITTAELLKIPQIYAGRQH